MATYFYDTVRDIDGRTREKVASRPGTGFREGRGVAATGSMHGGGLPPGVPAAPGARDLLEVIAGPLQGLVIQHHSLLRPKLPFRTRCRGLEVGRVAQRLHLFRRLLRLRGRGEEEKEFRRVWLGEV